MTLSKDDVSRALAMARAKRNRTIEYLCRAFLQFDDDSPDTASKITAFLAKHGASR